ncbi:LamG-like jellyroll fold domain-containing protein [Micromonospora andamanensis]|uniref:LamG-like jellyroll fold domain-containing protein n=1 Tax=Micromonospora andamanensis TaxID=1287068 RepID=UPI003639C3C8
MRRQVVTGLLIGGLAVTGLGVPAAAGHSVVAPQAQAQAQAQAQTKGEEQAPPGSVARATADARRSGQPVEVTAQRGEFKDVHANPDGSLRETLHLNPVRVRRGGDWAAVDTTLKPAGAGRFAPVATGGDVSFSGGGDGPAVRLAEGSAELALTWPTPLPAPTLAGDTATYAEVIPGVDLRLTATARGFSKVFVVKSRSAARDPRVAKMAFGLTVKGADVKADKHGNVEVTGPDGKQLFAMRAPAAWDSSRPEPRRALGRVTLEPGRLMLTPDAGLLTDERTTFPVHIDPSFERGKTGWALVASNKPNQSYWGGHDGEPTVAKVGPCPLSFDPSCVDVGTAISYFQYNASPMVGKQLISAEFNIVGTYSPACVAKPVKAYGTTPVSSGTTWSNQPYGRSSSVLLGQHNAAFYNSGPDCRPRWLGFNALEAVRKGVRDHGGTVAIALVAGDTHEYAWKKFDASNPTLAITYNSEPTVPSALSVEGKGCKQSPNEPHVNPRIDNDPLKGPRGPRLTATGSDPDAGSVQVEFEWANYSGTRIGGATTVMKSSGSTFTTDVASAAAPDGAKLAVRARAKDSSLTSNWTSPWCHVVVDRTLPKMPAVTSTVYRECDGEDCQATGGVGRTGAFTLTAAAGDTDVAGYRYHLLAQAPTYIQADSAGRAVAQVTPADDMTNQLYVQAVDRAGNVSPPRIYLFFVGAGTPPVGHWRLDGHGDTTVYDTSSGRRHGTINNSAAGWWDGRHGRGLWMNGTLDASVTTSGTAPLDTSASFAVSAWARLDGLGDNPTVVSQDGNFASAMRLHATSAGQWAFTMYSEDSVTPTIHRVFSDRPARVGAWTHLVALYDAVAKKQTLYVDGRAAGSLTRPAAAWRGEGALALGRAKWVGGPFEPWRGIVDDVRVYDRLLTAREIADLANLPALPEAQFPLDDRLGATTVDVAARHHVATFGTGTSQVAGRVGAGAVDFDGGTGGALTTPGPVVRTDNSFTVAAWVKPDADSYNTTRTVVSQHGQFASGLNLQYRPDKGWSFMLFHEDELNAQRTIAATPASPGQSEWLHLVGVYDAAAQEIRLYKDGEPVAIEPYTLPSWHANGSMEIGRAKYNREFKDNWKGAIDNVQVWAGALTDDQIFAEFAEPTSVKETPYSGQLSRWWFGGRHVTTNMPVSAGHYFERGLGMLTPIGAEGTRTIYSCRINENDYYLSAEENCEGYTRLGALGGLYISVPADVPTVPVYRCVRTANRVHFHSNDPGCEGQTVEFLMGHALAYGNLVAAQRPSTPPDRVATVYELPGEYRADQKLGITPLLSGPGTVPLMRCRSGDDTFSSTDPACEGATVLGRSGNLWGPDSPPEGVTELGTVWRCRTDAGEVFEAANPDCDGGELVAFLGYTIVQF